MNSQDVIAQINQSLGASYKIAGRYAAGESGVASKVMDEDANRYVLKFGAGHEFRPKYAAQTTQRLRSLGYPAPEYVAVGSVEQASYSLQRVMRGEPIGLRVQPALLPQLLDLNLSLIHI